MTNGFVRIAAASPALEVANVDYNVNEIIATADLLEEKRVEIAVFPELSITAYTCGDLFHSSELLDSASKGLDRIISWSANHNMHLIVGLPMRMGNAIYNCAAFVHNGAVDIVRKRYIPNYNEFYERRWFAPSNESSTDVNVFESHGAKIGIEICEDLWVAIPPSSRQSLAGAQILFNLSASDDLIGKYNYLKSLVVQQSARCIAAYAYASAGFGESSTDLVFTGKNLIAENGAIIAECDPWENNSRHYAIADIDIEALNRDRYHTTTFSDCAYAELDDTRIVNSHSPAVTFDDNFDLAYRTINSMPFVPSDDNAIDERCNEIINIQTAGLAKRLKAINCKKLVVGISGGLDSTLALLIAVNTFDRLKLDRSGIIAITMPGFGTTGRTYNNAIKLMESLNVSIREISIADAVTLHFKDIGHDASVHDATYENSQARERTQILMDTANQENAIVLGTGDLSELALGWATYNGDHMSMYGINAGIPKTLVRYLVKWFALRTSNEIESHTLFDIIETPISPELIPADSNGNIKQKTEDLVGPYELHDFFLYYTLRYGFSPRRIYFLAKKAFTNHTSETILKWLRIFFRRFFNQQFKRSCLPDGPKVGSVCLSPRGDWRMPSDASAKMWLKEIDELRP